MKNSDDSGYTGKHVGVCVLDTGYFSSYSILQGEYLRFKISSDIVSDLMMIILMEPMYGGIIGGDGRASEGRIRGIAPGCGLIVLKVLDRTGNGRKEDVLQAFRWILENKRYYGIRVVEYLGGNNLQESRRSQSSDCGCGTTLGCRSGW